MKTIFLLILFFPSLASAEIKKIIGQGLTREDIVAINRNFDELRKKIGNTSLNIGSLVIGGTANRVLYIDSTGDLANDSDFTFDGTALTVGSGTGLFARDGKVRVGGGTDLNSAIFGIVSASIPAMFIGASASSPGFVIGESVLGSFYANSPAGIAYFRGTNGTLWVSPHSSGMNPTSQKARLQFLDGSPGSLTLSDASFGVGSATETVNVTLSTSGFATFAMQTTTPTAASGTASLWAVDMSGSAELKVIDGAGNITPISPHNDDGEWVFESVNVKTGKRVYINMEKFIRRMEELTGETFIEGNLPVRAGDLE